MAELERDDGIATNPPWTGDLDGMVERRFVRLLVVPSRTDYYLDHGEPKGVTAEYALEFERRLNRRFQTGARPIRVVFVPVVRDDLCQAWFRQRRYRNGEPDDHARAPADRRFLAADPHRRPRDRRHRPRPAELTSLDDLAGREILTRRSSSYWPSLEALNVRLRADGLMGLRLQAVLEAVDDEDLLELVASGRLPLAVVDDHKARAWQRALPTLVLRDDLVLRSGGDIAWGFRKDSPQLADLWSPSPRPRPRAPSSAMSSPTATWWLPAAAHQRCRRPQALPGALGAVREMGRALPLRSAPAGGPGLPGIGARPEAPKPFRCSRHHADPPRDGARPSVDVARIDRLENNVQAGAKYLRHLIDVYFADPAIADFDRMLLALAAYNAGPSRITGLRRRAARRGSTPIAGSARSSSRPSATSAARPWPMSATS